MRTSPSLLSPVAPLFASLLTLGLLCTAVLLIFLYAPTEATMGEVQRIVYLHVPMAWCSLLGSLASGTFGMLYIRRRELAWDHWFQAAAEIGWLCVTLTLISGSLWAHEAWGVWWTWEPRLTSLLVLWVLFAGIFLVRAGHEDPHARARLGAVLSILAVADLPLIVMATRWFRGVHPVSPEMDGSMRRVLLVAAVSFLALFACCLVQRRRQLGLVEHIAVLEATKGSL